MKLIQEQESRDLQDQQLCENLKQTFEQIRADIETERQSRIQTEENFLQILENSMNKLK